MNAEHRLATYGSLAPGRPNNDQLDGIDGRWFEGTLHGHLINLGRGAGTGYPGLVLDDAGPGVEVHILESILLPTRWAQLDEFEGAEYERVAATAQTSQGVLAVSLYVLRQPTADWPITAGSRADDAV